MGNVTYKHRIISGIIDLSISLAITYFLLYKVEYQFRENFAGAYGALVVIIYAMAINALFNPKYRSIGMVFANIAPTNLQQVSPLRKILWHILPVHGIGWITLVYLLICDVFANPNEQYLHGLFQIPATDITISISPTLIVQLLTAVAVTATVFALVDVLVKRIAGWSFSERITGVTYVVQPSSPIVKRTLGIAFALVGILIAFSNRQ